MVVVAIVLAIGAVQTAVGVMAPAAVMVMAKVLGPLGAHWMPSWRPLGIPWCVLGLPKASLALHLASMRLSWEPFEALLGLSWDPLGASGSFLGAFLGVLGPPWHPIRLPRTLRNSLLVCFGVNLKAIEILV